MPSLVILTRILTKIFEQKIELQDCRLVFWPKQFKSKETQQLGEASTAELTLN